MREILTANDLRVCIAEAETALLSIPDEQWDYSPSNSDWDRRKIVRHVTWAVLGYASLLAVEREHGPADFLLLEHRKDSAEYTVNRLRIAGELLIAVTKGVEPTARAWHPHGVGDAEGFLALACSEISMHIHDVMLDTSVPFQVPAETTGRIVRRLYPWAPEETPPWETLKWATGRAQLQCHEDAGGDWWAFLSPLEEWDGEVWKRPKDYQLPDIGHPPIFQA